MEPRRALPEKKYFKIGEVADLVGVEPHVLRYWETQFPQIRPHKARSGHRLYRRREVEALLVIRELLHVQRFTIAGARQALRQPGGLSALLPRFFEAPSLEAGAPGDDSGQTLRPGPADESESGAGEHVDVIELEAHGLDSDELAAAMEEETAELVARHGVVEVDVEAEAAPVAAPRQPARAMPLHVPSLSGASLSAGGLPRGLDGRQRDLLHGALADARSILALLDRLDQDAGRDRVHA